MFFDGETFRLERLHRAVKPLRHVRQPGESAAAAAAAAASSAEAVEPRLSPVAKAPKTIHVGRSSYPAVSVSFISNCFDLRNFRLIFVDVQMVKWFGIV